MTTKQYTQGDWKPRRPDPNTGNVRITEGDLTVAIAVCADWGYEHAPDRSTAKANAQLIAAAPDLFEALDYLLQQTVDMDLKYGIALSDGEEDARAKALAAIAKARS